MGQAVYRFGNFEVDTGAHALLKDGARLSIQEQPFQVLLALVENPGQVVTREALRVRLWGTDTFVDFDQSLNSALRRLRLALDDNSRDPIYVETIPRIGFRFLPEVCVEAQPSSTILMSEKVAPAILAESAPQMPLLPVAAEVSRRSFPGVAGAVAALTFLLGVLLGTFPSQWKRVADPKGVAASSRETPIAAADRVPAMQETSPVLPAQASSSFSPVFTMADTNELEGWYHLKQRTQGDYVQAQMAFERTLAVQPQNAPAMVGLAQTEILMALNGDQPGKRLPHARSVGQQALLVSPHLAAAHAVVGAVDALVDWNDAGAEQEFTTALHLQPHDSLTHLWYAVFVLMPQRHYHQAEAEAMLAVREDPLSLIAHTNLGWILYTEGKRQAALEQYRFVLQLKPDFVPARFRVTQLLRAEGQQQDLKQVAALTFGKSMPEPAVLAATGDVSPRCEQLPAPDSNDPHALAVLRAGVQQHCLQEYFFGQNPELAKLQKLPAFAELVNTAHPVHPLR